MSGIALPPLATAFDSDTPPASLRWFRNGIAPPATGALNLSQRLNLVMGQRVRCLFTRTFQDADFDPTGGTTTDTIIARFAAHTGPVGGAITVRFLMLPTSATITGPAFLQLVLYPELAGATTPITLLPLSIGPQGTTSGYSNEFDVSFSFGAGSSHAFRYELHTTNSVRPVSVAAYEIPVQTLDTVVTPESVDPAPFVQGQPITTAGFTDMIKAADDIWKLGKPLLSFSAKPGSEPSISSATPSNFVDQLIKEPSTDPGEMTPYFPVNVQYSSTIDDTSVPVVFWAYAECPSGTGAIQFIDHVTATVYATLTVSGTAAWYSFSGHLIDDGATPASSTTGIEIYINGDATHTLKLYACGVYIHDGSDVQNVPAHSWSPVSPHYIGYRTEVISSNK